MKYLITLLLSLLTGCFLKHNPEPRWDTYKIKEGRHYSAFKIKQATSYVSFQADMSGAIYDTLSLGDDKYDWNKLYGFSSWNNHQDSWRIGFRFLNGRFEYSAYYYVDGVRGFQNLGWSEIGEIAGFTIDVGNGEAIFRIDNGQTILIKSGSLSHYYRSFPYFGGNRKAPNEIIIKILER